MLNTFITTEPNIVNYQDNTNIIEKWQKYWHLHSNLNKQILHFPLSSIEYNSDIQLDLTRDFDAVFFISPNAVKSYHNLYKNYIPSKNIWLIGSNSHAIFSQYYQNADFNVTYIESNKLANSKNLLSLLNRKNKVFNNQSILIIKSNLGNNFIYKELYNQYNANIEYLITYTKIAQKYTQEQLSLLKDIILKDKRIDIYISSSDTLYTWKYYLSNIKNQIDFNHNFLHTIYAKYDKIQLKAQEIFSNTHTDFVLIDK